jgi:hypothetical protein
MKLAIHYPWTMHLYRDLDHAWQMDQAGSAVTTRSE